jgi:DNA-binding XRE family transcriptional regulator
MPVAINPRREDLKRAAARSREWKQFRRDFMYSQKFLAHTLKCSRRTICAIENGRESITPHADLLRKFRDLKRRHEKQEMDNRQTVSSAYIHTHHLDLGQA